MSCALQIGIGIGIEIVIEVTRNVGSKEMSLGHEKLDVYRLSIEYAAWVCAQAGQLKGIHRHSRDQWLRASQSIALNIAEGNGRTTSAHRRRFFEIARGSALECAAIQDVLVLAMVLNDILRKEKKICLERIVAMLSRMGGRGYQEQDEVQG